MGSIEIIAHRGFSASFPENTLPALEGALEAGARALEWDIRVTADGVPVLFHDDRLDRTTSGRGSFSPRSHAELAALDAGSWFDPQFTATRIPTLEETLTRIAGRVDRIYPEVKAVRSPADLDLILGLLRETGWHERTVLISLDHALLEEARRRDPEICLGWVVSKRRDLARCARRVEEDGRAVLDPAARFLLTDPEHARELAARVPLATWTVDDPADAHLLFEMGVRRITTNRVDLLLAWARSVTDTGVAE